ncbi:hypothetical protein GCM10027570_31090 [Streptomonospora sediminis]
MEANTRVSSGDEHEPSQESAVDLATLLFLSDLARRRQLLSARDLQRLGASVLSRLIATDLPTVTWHVRNTAGCSDLIVKEPHLFPLVDGQANSHAAVRDWAARLGVPVQLDFGNTPTARATVDGVGVCVWCAPDYRDDITADASASSEEGAT